MKKRKGKTKRWLAGILSAVLVIGSINLVDALEGSNGESALYDAPELTITQGATDYDLMKDITYDSSMYELAVVNDGGFDVNTVGDYEVTYSLTSKDDGTLEPGDSGDASNSDNENKDQNSGTDTSGADSSQGGDNSDAAGSGSNADNAGSSDSSDSSNGGDSADAGQGDTGSDSGNAGDNADAGQGDTGSDSSNAEDTADAVSGEDAAQSEENTGDTGVLGVSRPRTAVNMSYQSEPVNAEAVDVTEGDATNSGDTQEKQVITFTRMVHVVAASEDKEPVYVARELVLTQGEEDYDLTDDILYDDVKYTLEVVELGGFDINKIGSYEVTYSLTPVTTEGTQENGQDDTQDNQVITFQRTVTVKAAVEENALYEAPDLYLELGQEEYDLTEGIIYDKDLYEVKVSDPGDFDIYTLGEYEVTYVLDRLGKSAKAEDTQTSKTEETTASDEQKSEDNDGIQAATLELTDEKQSVDPADEDNTNSMEEKSPEVKTTSQEAVYFTRNVIVEMDYSFTSAVEYANVQGKYTIKLGTPVWTDETHKKFQYTNAKVNTNGDKISMMTITLSNGKLPDSLIVDAFATDEYKKSATWIFINGLSAQELQEKIHSMVFDYVDNMNVYISINGNENQGLDQLNSANIKLTQWNKNGHYYLYIEQMKSWSDAFNFARTLKIAGQQGYLSTFTSVDEITYLRSLSNNRIWTGGTVLLKSNGARINGNESEINRKSGSLKIVTTDKGAFYWACGPESGTGIANELWANGEPNGAAYINQTLYDTTISDIQNKESCVMVLISKGLNDVFEGNYNDNFSDTKGFFIEFGGYADGADPGQPDSSKKGEVSVVAAPMDAEASINGVKYAPLADALELAEADEEVQIIKENVTEVTNGMLKNSSIIKEMNGNTVHADSNGTNIDVSDTGAITLRSGAVTVSNTDANVRKITVDGYVLTSTADYTVKAVDTSNDTTLGDSQVSVTLKAVGDTFTAVKNGATYTYTATKDNQTFYLGEYSAVLNWEERSGVAALASIGSPEFPAELVKPQTQPNNPYHQLTLYTVTIKPREDYSIDVDKVWVSMGVDAQGAPQMLDASEFNISKDQGTGNITVTVKKPVNGDLIYYVGKVNGGSSSGSTVTHDRTTIQVTSAAGSAVTTPEFTATYFDEQKSKDITVSSQNGKVEVFKNVEVTLKFPAMNPSDPNPTEADLGITEDETFDILTKLAETGSTIDLKAGFDWTDKSYTYKFTSTSASYNLEASYEKSHVVHIHVSGGSMDTNTIPAGLEANTQSASNIRIIVPDQTTLDKLKFSPDGSLQNPSFTAKWLSHDNTTDLGAVNFSEDAGSWKGSTLAVTQPSYLNVSFVAGQMLTIRIKGGTLDTAYGTPVRNWITKAAASSGFDHEYQLVVPENDQTVHFKINVEGSNILKSILANTKDVTSMVEAVKDQNNRIIAYTNGDAGSTIGEATTIDVTLVPSCTVTFWNKEVSPEKKLGTEVVMDGGKLDKAAYAKMAAAAVLPGYQFMAWKDTAGKVYTDQTVISAATELHAVFREKANISQNGNIIAANDFKIHLNSIKKGAFNTSEAVKRAKAEAYDANGKDVTTLISVEGLDAVLKEGTFPLTFKYGDASITVNVTVTNAIPVVTGKTAYTLTFEGVPNGASEYKVYSMSGAVVAGAKIEETANGIYRITGLEKGTEYKIDGDVLGSTTGKTALVDAEDIAKQFEDKQGDTKTNGEKGKDEKAENPNVKVVVDDDGNYKVIVKKDINHSVEIPDTWENVKIDLGGHTITGNNADASNEAKPGLVFKKDDTATEHPGTNLEIVNGTIQGGSGSAAHPDGAAGVGEAAGSKPSQAGITVGADAVIKGGNGADGENGSNGGNGGSGIEGTIGTTVNGGSVSGGNGGKGSDSATGTPGNGGNGGSGIKTDKDVVINGGTITGGNAGNGGNAAGENNTNPGGSGGNGGSGVNSSSGKIDNNRGTITGGDAGNGGNSEKGNGGTGGNGGSGSIGETNNTNGGTTTGGNGGNGGNSNNGGSNGNGGSGGKGTEGTVNEGNQDGNNGQNGKIFFVILFKDQKKNLLNAADPCKVAANGKITKDYFGKMQEKTDAQAKADEKFFAWTEENHADKVYTAETEITASVTLVPVYRADSNVVPGQDGNTIAADNFSIRIEKVGSLTETEAKKLANVKAYDKKGADITNTVTVDQNKLSALQQSTAGIYPDALTFEIPGSVKVSVTVEITDDSPVITGKTAHTLTFKGRANETYEYQELDAQGTPTGKVLTILTDGDGKATITGLKKATPYQISHKKYGSVNGKTALVDAKDIAKQFEDRGAGDTKGNNATDRTEKAENSNVQVVVDDDGNYKVIVKKDIDHTVEIPDTWGEVKIDLGRHTITGDKADDNNAAKPGLDFVKDGSINEHPGTKLEIVNGTIKGGDGSAKHPDGAPGIGAAGNAADAGLIIGNDAKVIGGNGANGTEGKDGGNGGAGIDGNGKITPTVNGTVTGGNGGKGGDSATGIPGNGGNGGTGISAGDKTITIHPGGTVKGGDAGSGGSATGGNTNPGGNGGNGGTGTETTQPGKTDNNGGTTSGGNGGDGGNSNNGNGGNGGNGGSGSTGENNNNGGTSSGGNGGNGGDSDKGNGGSGGNGGSSGETGGNGGNNTGGNGGNGGDSNSGNGGSGGNGGDSNSGTGGNGGNGGDSNNGTGGNGGNGGGSNNGTGGNGGNGGNSNNGNGGNGGNGGDSNSGNNGNGGSSGSNGNRPGGNGGGSNNGNGGNGGNNGGGNSGNNGGDNSGNNGGDNSGNNGGDNGGNNGGDNSNNNSGSTGNTGNTPDAGNTAGNDSGNNAHKGNKGNSTGNSNAGQKDPAEDDSLNDAADESSLTGDADGSDADGSDADGIQEEESIHADSDSVENGTDSDSHIPFGECGFHWIPIVWLLVILGYTVVRVKKLRDESEEA